MKATRVVVAALALALAWLAPAAFPDDAQAATCFTTTLGGTYVYSLAGVGPDGLVRSEMGVVAITVADASGFGTFSGTSFLSVRGLAPDSGPTSGSYQIFPNCFINFAAPAGLFMGYASDNGAFVQFASPFDSGTQLTGVARRAQ
jgi:hypothetical protein